MLVVAEYPGTGPLQAVEDLWGRVPVGVVRADLDDGYLREEAAEERGVEEVLEP